MYLSEPYLTVIGGEIMSKTEWSRGELLFLGIITLAFFSIVIYQMSLDGILPGNDPAVHLAKTKIIMENNRVTYRGGEWYPPLFHVFLAASLLLAGTTDIWAVSLIVKLLVSGISVLMLLSTYLLSRKWFGRDIAVTSAVFTMLSLPIFEMIDWGGYPNFLGLVFIPLIFYVMTCKEMNLPRACILFLLTFSLILTHQLAAFVFCLLAVPVLLITTKKREKRHLLFLSVALLASILAILVWYAEMLLRYSSILISHIFFEMKQYTQNIPSVSFTGFIHAFGISVFLAIAGLPLIFISKKNKLKSVILALWIAVPFLLSQSYFFGLYLPYERFVYFLVTPVAILSGITVNTLTKIPSFITQKISGEKTAKRETPAVVQVAICIILITIFSFQGILSFQRGKSLPGFYDVSGVTGYSTGQWLKHHSLQNSTVVVSEKPGAWLYVISDRDIIEEVNPIFGRNQVAETVLGTYYEMENSHILTREYVMEDVSGQALYISIYNLWEKVVTIPDKEVYVTYQADGKEVKISLSETEKEIYWGQRSPHESQLVCEYSHKLFSLEKKISIGGDRLVTEFGWKLRVHQNLTRIRLRVFTYTSPSVNFTEAFIPGVLDWQNPWDAPTYRESDSWAVVECPPSRWKGDVIALFDADNNILMAFEYGKAPDWLNVGALDNRVIDAIRVGYKFGDMKKGESQEVFFSCSKHSPECNEKKWNITSLKQILDLEKESKVEVRDVLTYIDEYNIQFVTVNYRQLLSKSDLPLFLDRVYDSGEFVTYKVEE